MNKSKALIYVLLLFVTTNLNSYLPPFSGLQSKLHSFYAFYIPHPAEHLDGADYFFKACFEFPDLLKKAHLENKSVLLIIPETYEKVATTEETAPFIEGARIALAWASAYFRFANLGNTDVRTLVIPKNLTPKEFLNNVTYTLNTSFQSIKGGTPEKKMAQRIINSKDFTVQIYEYTTDTIIQKTTSFINPHTDKKTIVITGAAGFLGSHLAKAYLEKNFVVIGFDNFICSTEENLVSLKSNPHFIFHEFDVSQPYTIDGRVDFIAHLASIPSPADYYKMPLETLRSGLHGAKEALELSVKKNARILLASSSEVYGNPEVHPQSEEYRGNVNPIAMRSQYDESKRGEETLCKIYFDKHKVDIRIARIFNTFGPGMRLSDGRVMTNFIQAALDNTPMIIHGDGTQTRSPAFVTDTIQGLMLFLESDEFSKYENIQNRICNIGTPKEYDVNQIAETVNNVSEKYIGRRVPMKHISHIDPTDPKIRRPDITRISTITGFKPIITFEEGIEKMFVHYMEKYQTH